MSGLADLAEREGLWLHVDAAYGGFFLLTERGRRRMRGIDRADSITLDPHKGLFLPYGTGCLLVRHRAHLQQAHAVTADYLPAMQGEPSFVDFCQVSPELSRDFRGLRVWLPIKMHGIVPFQHNLNEKLELAEWAAGQLQALKAEIAADLEIIAEPQLSIVAFRLRCAGWAESALQRLNEDLRARINAGRRVMLSSTLLDGRYVIRICVLSFRTHQPQLEECLREIRRAILELQSAGRLPGPEAQKILPMETRGPNV